MRFAFIQFSITAFLVSVGVYNGSVETITIYGGIALALFWLWLDWWVALK